MKIPDRQERILRAKAVRVIGVEISSGADTPGGRPVSLVIQFLLEGGGQSPHYSMDRDKILPFVNMIAAQTELMRIRDEQADAAAPPQSPPPESG